MKTILPTNSNTPIIVDDNLYPILSGIKWYETRNNYFRPSSWRTYGKKDIHRWVCWLNNKKIKNKHVHHINENRNDNRLINLQISDMKEHASIHHKGKVGFVGESNPMYRQDVTLKHVFGLISRGFNVKSISKILNTNPETIYKRIRPFNRQRRPDLMDNVLGEGIV
jgi:hypothetical protein